jgi:hypothetical protein
LRSCANQNDEHNQEHRSSIDMIERAAASPLHHICIRRTRWRIGHRHSLPVRLGCVGCSVQFGPTSILFPRLPQSNIGKTAIVLGTAIFVAANWAPASLHFLVGYRQGEYRHDLPVLDYMLDPSYKADDGDATA